VILPQHLTAHVIEPVLASFGLLSDSAIKLLLGTAAAESTLGLKLVQTVGPALGIYQCEPATHDDVIRRVSSRKPEYLQVLAQWAPQFSATQLPGNLYYATAICRLHYWLVPHKLPSPDDVVALAGYWKQHYNTHLGAGTVQHFIDATGKLLGWKRPPLS
jgi:hypothetical protein